MAGRFPLYTDADVHGPLIDALRAHGWHVVRAVDLYPQGTSDAVHFEHAAKENRVLVSNDTDMEVLANRCLAEGRPFRGLILWRAGSEARGTLRAIPAFGDPPQAWAVGQPAEAQPSHVSAHGTGPARSSS